MNEIIKISIDSRKQALLNAYNITDKKVILEIDDLFNKIYEFGENYSESEEFEKEFSNSPLNEEYLAFFTELATKYKPRDPSEINIDINTDTEKLSKEMKSKAPKEKVKVLDPLKRRLKWDIYEKAREIPGIGDILDAKNTIDLLKTDKNDGK